MDIDEQKKRKVEEIETPPNINLDEVLKASIESSQNMAKLLAILTQKVLIFEKVFNKDIFKE